ncbi:MAG TPA: SPFH domain-containing protein [Steroidobacteraceae bacterium]|jgi:regulator of protease activity HflC (stomatin/prohibitin superfamily)|nr:SPFH domain-containing protein [Steroidobacteraceae bacterium]
MNALPDTPAAAAATPLPVGPPPMAPPGPIAQSVAIGFRSVYIATALLLLIWLTSNVREIASDSQAVVRRFGRIVRSQEAGLLIAWPRPIEQVQLLPGPERQLSQDVPALQAPTEQSAALIGPGGPGSSLPANAAAYLTGDGNAVLLNATLVYRINDPIAYALEETHVPAALDRLFQASAVQVAAGRDLNDFLVVPSTAQQLGLGQGSAVVALRAEVRNTLLQSVNARLQALTAAGTPLGVDVERIDMTPLLPPEAKSAFDAVLVAAQAADRGVATARTDAERRRQGATQLSEQLISSAQATAREMVSGATVATSAILPLEREETPLTRGSLLLHQYRARVSDIMNRVGAVTLIDPKSGARFLMPGGQMRPQAPPTQAAPGPALTPPTPLEITPGTPQ